jgi:beta-alanine--pyruvate transaminase
MTSPLDAAAGELSLEELWMPFTANRAFKKAPRLLASASGMHYRDLDGRKVLDGTSGLWCVNAGHCRPQIVEAIQRSAATLDFAPGFQMGHPSSFALARALAALAPGDLDHVFFANSGSEAVDSALKIALAYHQARGEPERVRFVGRLRGYHGVGFGGISVGGIESNRKAFAAQLLPLVDHLPHTHDLPTTPSAADSRPGARTWRTRWRRSSPGGGPAPSPRSSSSRWPARPGCWCRRRAISRSSGPSATPTASS